MTGAEPRQPTIPLWEAMPLVADRMFGKDWQPPFTAYERWLVAGQDAARLPHLLSDRQAATAKAMYGLECLRSALEWIVDRNLQDADSNIDPEALRVALGNEFPTRRGPPDRMGDAGLETAPRGRPSNVLNSVTAAIIADIESGTLSRSQLADMKQQVLADQYNASRKVCAQARKKVLSEMC